MSYSRPPLWKRKSFSSAGRSSHGTPEDARDWPAAPFADQIGLVVALRLDETSRSIEDYLILQDLKRIPKLSRPYYHLSAGNDHGAVRVATEVDLIAALKRRIVAPSKAT
jgi:hypothetical protein